VKTNKHFMLPDKIAYIDHRTEAMIKMANSASQLVQDLESKPQSDRRFRSTKEVPAVLA